MDRKCYRFSNEEGKKGRIQAGQFADLIVPDKDFFACAEDEISFLTSELTMVGGKIVWGSGPFESLDDNPVPPAMPDWSPTRTFKGYAAGANRKAQERILLPYGKMRWRPVVALTDAICTGTIMLAHGHPACRFQI